MGGKDDGCEGVHPEAAAEALVPYIGVFAVGPDAAVVGEGEEADGAETEVTCEVEELGAEFGVLVRAGPACESGADVPA